MMEEKLDEIIKLLKKIYLQNKCQDCRRCGYYHFQYPTITYNPFGIYTITGTAVDDITVR